MGSVSTALDELKNAPPAGKALIVVSLLTVAGIGLWASKNNKSTSPTTASLLPIDLSGNNTDGSVPFPNVPTSSTSPTSPSPPSQPSKPTTPTSPILTGKPVLHQPPPKKPVTGGHKVSPPPTAIRTVTVQKYIHGGYGEMSTLSAIAQKYYGNANLWTKIYNANKNQISNPNLIYTGQRLIVPN